MPKRLKPLQIDLVTLFPEACLPYLEASILGRAQKAGLAKFSVHQLREWTHDAHHTVDDKPFGGGPGMVMKIEPIHEALTALGLVTKKGKKTAKAKKTRVIVTSAKGKLFTQADAKRLTQYERLVFICGRYEGIDERVATQLADEELSIGQYVLTGGELPALVMSDAVTRLRPGVLGKEASLDQESWTNIDTSPDAPQREYPQYTRPEKYLGWDVPEILLSGDHKKIREWRSGETR